uniref:Uncharacterized protein n=1 Tax=Anguilla anguilla TaxID=7936 RepID=A0A0E9VYQ5_ANGAN
MDDRDKQKECSCQSTRRKAECATGSHFSTLRSGVQKPAHTKNCHIQFSQVYIKEHPHRDRRQQFGSILYITFAC